MIVRTLLVNALLLLANLSLAEPNTTFDSYPVETVIDNELVNFAGSYQIKYTPCGSSGCITAEIYDPINKKTIGYYPDAYIMIDDDEDKEFSDKYRINSNLLMIQGVSSIDLKFRRSYYLFTNNKLTLLKEELAAKDIVISNLQVWIDTKEKALITLGKPDSKSKTYNEIDDLDLTVWKYGESELYFDKEHIYNFTINDKNLNLTMLKPLSIGLPIKQLEEFIKNRNLEVVKGDNTINFPIKDSSYYLTIHLFEEKISQISSWQDN